MTFDAAGGGGSAPDAKLIRHLRFDFSARPFLVLFEVTRACDLACRHCRAEAAPDPDPDELSTQEVLGVLDDLASLGAPRPIVVLTGGDPLRRTDLLTLVRRGAAAGLAMSVAPAGTPRATPSMMRALRAAGVRRISLSLDGATAAAHDRFRGTPGSFSWTLAACAAARHAGLQVQLNTTVSAETVDQLPQLLALALRLEVNLWSLFFLVSVGRGQALEPIGPEAVSDVLELLHDVAAPRLPVKTTEAPAYRRVVLQHAQPDRWPAPSHGAQYHALRRRAEELLGDQPVAPQASSRRRPPLAVGDGRGVVFVAYNGNVQPSGFLPLVVGNVRTTRLSELYATAPLLNALRDPERLRGRCGRCELRDVCGGSRARAWASSGDPLGEDPACTYEPRSATSPAQPMSTPFESSTHP